MIFGAIAFGIIFVIRWFFKKEMAPDPTEKTILELQKKENSTKID